MKVFLKDIADRYPEFEVLNYNEEAFFTRFNHDSRDIREGDIFVPIVGDNFDGHDFINDALSKGASMALCENSKYSVLEETDKPIILVDSIEEGLEKIVNYAISPITAPVIAITGSTGKTTTKQMLVKILESKKSVLFSDSFNTVWGNAMLLSEYSGEDVIALECGMDRKGEIAWHCNSFDPEIGILLNVGYVHAEKLGSIEEVYQEKKNLADYLSKNGKPLVLNIDDDRLARIAKYYQGELITVGSIKNADFRFKNVVVNDDGTDFNMYYKGKEYPVHINAYGEELAYNAVCAIACAYQLGIELDSCLKHIRDFNANNGRFETVKYGDDFVVVNDAYNANPTSMKMSLKTFDSLYSANEYYRIAVLGDMRELGDVSSELHSELAKEVQTYEFNEIYYLGNYSSDFNLGKFIESPDEMATLLINKKEELRNKKVAVLLKGSHGVGIYKITEFLKELE
jgi:UDP-N-acetylmuramoyl-tripeptide--D-alanyl-D-alanine ligase